MALKTGISVKPLQSISLLRLSYLLQRVLKHLYTTSIKVDRCSIFKRCNWIWSDILFLVQFSLIFILLSSRNAATNSELDITTITTTNTHTCSTTVAQPCQLLLRHQIGYEDSLWLVEDVIAHCSRSKVELTSTSAASTQRSHIIDRKGPQWDASAFAFTWLADQAVWLLTDRMCIFRCVMTTASTFVWLLLFHQCSQFPKGAATCSLPLQVSRYLFSTDLTLCITMSHSCPATPAFPSIPLRHHPGFIATSEGGILVGPFGHPMLPLCPTHKNGE